jgi:quinol monooxygenase YgiN
MYGTVALMKVKPGQGDAMLKLNREEMSEAMPQVKGYVGQYLFKLDENPDQFVLIALFQDKASYVANAGSPEQDKRYRRLRELLAADPMWHDGEVAFEHKA